MRLSEIATRPLPLVSFPKLFHVGTMNVADKQRGSYEGAGLSVSLHPEEWMHIAEIGGPIWECRRRGNKFIDYYKLSKHNKDVISMWAVHNGWGNYKTVWRVTYVVNIMIRKLERYAPTLFQCRLNILAAALILGLKIRKPLPVIFGQSEFL